jgi:cell division protein FtsB
LAQFIAIIVLTISVFLVVDFARRTAATYKIKAEAARLEQEVAQVRAQRQELEAHLNYVKSDAYVEEIARTQLKWAKEGETVVVIMATALCPSPPGRPGGLSSSTYRRPCSSPQDEPARYLPSHLQSLLAQFVV